MIHRRRLRSRSPSSRVVHRRRSPSRTVHRRRSPSRTVHRRRSPSSSSSRVVHRRRSPLRAVHRRASPLRAVHRHRSPVHRRGSSRAVHRRGSSRAVHRRGSSRAMSTSPVRIHLKSIGALSRFGYAAHESMHARHAALLEAARHNGATEVVKRLNVLYIYNKNHHPALAKVFRSDLHWLQRQRDTGVVA